MNYPTGTEVNYFAICQRKLWFFINHIHMEGEHDRVAVGRHIHEATYMKRAQKSKEWQHGPIKLDYFDTRTQVIHEVKLSDKMESAHRLQVMYYMYYLSKYGFSKVSAIIEYPKLRKTEKLAMSDLDIGGIESVILQVDAIKKSKVAPPKKVKRGVCTKCAYYDLCFAGEE